MLLTGPNQKPSVAEFRYCFKEFMVLFINKQLQRVYGTKKNKFNYVERRYTINIKKAVRPVLLQL